MINEWDEFKRLNSRDYKEHMRSPNVVDARRIYDHGSVLLGEKRRLKAARIFRE